MNRGQQPVFPRHIVSRRSNGTERGTTQHEFGAAYANQISQVRMTARELLDLDGVAFTPYVRSNDSREPRGKIRCKRPEIDLFPMTYR
jgi:hypothetical protein